MGPTELIRCLRQRTHRLKFCMQTGMNLSELMLYLSDCIVSCPTSLVDTSIYKMAYFHTIKIHVHEQTVESSWDTNNTSQAGKWIGTLLGLAALLARLRAVCLVTLLRLTGSNQRQVIHSSKLYIWKVTFESYLSNQRMYNYSFENYCSTEADYIHNAY